MVFINLKSLFSFCLRGNITAAWNPYPLVFRGLNFTTSPRLAYGNVTPLTLGIKLYKFFWKWVFLSGGFLKNDDKRPFLLL